MIKAILFFVIGAGAAYLYMNPGDVDGMLEMGKQGIHNLTSHSNRFLKR